MTGKRNNETGALDARIAAKQRRRYIVTKVRENGRLSLEALTARYPNVAYQSINDDVNFLQEIGLPFVIIKKFITDRSDAFEKGTKDRKSLNAYEKDLAADLAVSCILGIHEKGRDRIQFREERAPYQLYEKHEILHSLQLLSDAFLGDSEVADRVKIVRHKWHEMLKETSRMIVLDSGTTNEKLASKLAALAIPVRGTNLNYLTVATNSRLIFNEIGDPEVPIRSIVIGGQQSGRTSSISGAIAEQFLRTATLLHFGVGIIGATAISTEKGFCYADSQGEAVMKGLLLDRCSMRIIIADNSKLAKNPAGGGYAVCALDPNFVDLIITNAPIHPDKYDDVYEHVTPAEKELHKHECEKFSELVDDIITTHKIPVLVATSKDMTIDFKYRVPFPREPENKTD